MSRTRIDDLLDLDDFNPEQEKEQYMGFHENIEKYAAQSNENEMNHGYPENTPPPDMFLKTLEKSRNQPPTGIRPTMSLERYQPNNVDDNGPQFQPPPQFQQPPPQFQQPPPQFQQTPPQHFQQEHIQENFNNATPIHDEIGHHGNHCLNISDHIQNCRICSKYYDTDKTIYIIIIVILLVICALLIRKVLDL